MRTDNAHAKQRVYWLESLRIPLCSRCPRLLAQWVQTSDTFADALIKIAEEVKTQPNPLLNTREKGFDRDAEFSQKGSAKPSLALG